MRRTRFPKGFTGGQPTHKNVAIAVALVVSALVATPVAMGASRSLAMPEEPAAIVADLRVGPVDAAPVATAPAAQPCLRKVRVVYGGYGTPSDGCVAR